MTEAIRPRAHPLLDLLDAAVKGGAKGLVIAAGVFQSYLVPAKGVRRTFSPKY